MNQKQTSAKGLQELEEQLKSDLDILDYPARSGVRSDPDESVANVLIVGGGQSALGIAAGLKLEKVPRIRIMEKQKKGKSAPGGTSPGCTPSVPQRISPAPTGASPT
jgi:hypothetical protein